MKIRQGDVILTKVDGLPWNAKKMEEHKLSIKGEPGHTHTMEDIDLFSTGRKTFALVPVSTALVHSDPTNPHPSIDVEKGVYEISRPRTYEARHRTRIAWD